ncbi:hypothetical protein ERO13_A01G232300v2 [Gossypium hirsutum]|nr:hypothetical protein ERO13_A01G232300v2 [Gossypium hirsutum]
MVGPALWEIDLRCRSHCFFLLPWEWETRTLWVCGFLVRFCVLLSLPLGPCAEGRSKSAWASRPLFWVEIPILELGCLEIGQIGTDRNISDFRYESLNPLLHWRVISGMNL